MNSTDINVIYEDNQIIVVEKPVNIPSQGDKTGDIDMLTIVKEYIKEKYNKPGEVYLGLVHRLDRPTGGVMVFARTSKAAGRLSEQIREGGFHKKYLAIVDGLIKHDTGTIDAPIGRDINDRQKMSVTDVNAKEAITHFKVLERFNNNTLIECKLETGRTHQIRVHMAYIGYPVNNDPVYNTKKADSFGQMLHSKSIRFKHPITGEEIYFEKEPPVEFVNKLNELDI